MDYRELKKIRNLARIATCIAILGHGYFVSEIAFDLLEMPSRLVVLSSILPVLPMGIMEYVWYSRYRRLVQETGGRFCSKCYFDLRGHSDTGECPECGCAFRFSDASAESHNDDFER